MTTLSAPLSEARPVVEILHGASIVDPYRWLEDQNSPGTRSWIDAQTAYTRAYLSGLAQTDSLKKRVAEFLDVETMDQLQKVGNRYFYLKRRIGEEQPGICMREGLDGAEQVLVDPAARWDNRFISVRILRIAQDGGLLAYEVRKGGERLCEVEFLDVATGLVLHDKLARGFLTSLEFAPDGSGVYYVHREADAVRQFYQAVRFHRFGDSFEADAEIFVAGEGPLLRVFAFVAGSSMYLVVWHGGERQMRDYYVVAQDGKSELLFESLLDPDRIIPREREFYAVTQDGAPNLRVVEVVPERGRPRVVREVVPETTSKIKWVADVGGVFFVVYDCEPEHIAIYSTTGVVLGAFDLPQDGSARFCGMASDSGAAWYSFESFTQPPCLVRRDLGTGKNATWWSREIPGSLPPLAWKRVSFPSKDGCQVPMYLAGRADILDSGMPAATIITGYGGGAVVMRPEFGILTTIMMERGCLFALPNVRGGGEFGPQWYEAARRRKRQTSINDFVAGVEYLAEAGYSVPTRIAAFGGCNGALLVAAAAMQRPDLFRAVLCIAPLLDMLRYHRFQRAIQWVDEYGTSEDAQDFAALQGYSPYHRVVDGTPYPAFMIVTGDLDDRVDPMHARKMTARLQEATTSGLPVILDYSLHRGHKPALPLGERVAALTARLAFLCDQLGAHSAGRAHWTGETIATRCVVRDVTEE